MRNKNWLDPNRDTLSFHRKLAQIEEFGREQQQADRIQLRHDKHGKASYSQPLRQPYHNLPAPFLDRSRP